MIRIAASYVEDVRNAKSGTDLAPLLQAAVELEHATIPPYLCAYFSLKNGSNAAVGEIIRSVVVEEMLHLTIASNLMIALGGKPALNSRSFVPDYPGGLPMGIGEHLQVHLRKCSTGQIGDVFMKIEEPEQPIRIPLAAAAEPAPVPDFATIGAFYLALADKIQELGDSAFTGTPEHQVVASTWFPDPEEMFAIMDVGTAVQGIQVIINQGEGTRTSPFDNEGAPAHYYRFEQIVNGRRLIPRPGSTPPYAYGGDRVELDMQNVWDMDEDPKVAKYKAGSLSRQRAEQFNYSYTGLLNSLHRTFNGHPGELDHALGLMFELRLLSQQVLSTAAEWADPAVTEVKQTGLSFEYQALGARAGSSAAAGNGQRRDR
ncbi:MAG TPA: ferritin-like protein [Streptosporangiaceae bacterium]|nr:ferritin-like protein [Streptosporangiaceae bacterium]